jgi:hypothetical protein
VTARSCSGLALIIDRDLGFVMWLGEVFSELGWESVPALHCRQGLALARRLNAPITTLVISPELPGSGRLVKALLAANPGMRVVLIGDSAANAGGVHARCTLERPAPWEPISRPEWVAKIRRVLARGSE